MTRDMFRIVGNNLTGRGLSFDVGVLGVPNQSANDRLGPLADMANVIYKQGRDSALISYDDRYALHCAVDALRALATIVGPTPTGDRYGRCADVVARLLHDQEGT